MPSRRRADPQSLHRPHVHRREQQPPAKGRNQIHAAARSAGRQTGDPGRGFDRPLHDDESLAQSDPRTGRRPRDSRPRGLPADHRALLLRHRHVDDRRIVRPAVSGRRRVDRRSPGRDGHAVSGPIRSAICRSSRSPAPSVSTPISSARPASPASIPTPAGQKLYQIALQQTNCTTGQRTYERTAAT